MSAHYLTIDGMLSGTGIRESVVGGYLEPNELGVSPTLMENITAWLRRYEYAHYNQFDNADQNMELDREGIAICKLIQKELPESRIEYFSSALMRKIPWQ